MRESQARYRPYLAIPIWLITSLPFLHVLCHDTHGLPTYSHFELLRQVDDASLQCGSGGLRAVVYP